MTQTTEPVETTEEVSDEQLAAIETELDEDVTEDVVGDDDGTDTEEYEETEEAEPGEAGAGAEPEATAEEEAAEPEPEEEPGLTLDQLRDMQVEQMRIQVQQSRDAAEHMRTAHDKLTGKVGPLNQQLLALQEENRRLRAGEQVGYDDPPPRHTQAMPPQQPELSQEQSQLNDLMVRESNRALDTVAQRFQAIPNIAEFSSEIAAYVSQHGDRVKQALTSADPVHVENVATALMQEGLMHAITAKIQGAEQRKVSQAEKHRKDKIIATPAGAGKPKPTRRPQKPVDQMSLKELEEEYKRQGRKGF